MNAFPKTIAYVVAALVAVGLAFLGHQRAKPQAVEGYEEVGTLFYPDPDSPERPLFDDPAEAKSLMLAVFDDETEELDTFEIAHRDGVWRLVDYNGYPTDAQTQLAKTLASVSMVRREALQTRRKSDHAELGVLDPLDEDSYVDQGHGERITIADANDKPLVDLIIGKRVPDSEPSENLYFVRRADQDEVYMASVDVSISTDFEDWINDDLLALDPKNDVEEFEPDEEPPVDETETQREARLAKEAEERERRRPAEIVKLRTKPSVLAGGGDVFDDLELGREDAASSWTLVGLDEETETFEKTPVEGVVETLENLKIIGVRKKPDRLQPDLTVAVRNRAEFFEVVQAITEDLDSKGFRVEMDEEKQEAYFVSTYGSLTATADNGVVYTLHLGDEFEATEEQLKIGDDEADSGEETTKGRFLVIRVGFDETAVRNPPGRPIPPVKPQPPSKLEEETKPEKPKPGESTPDEGDSGQDEEAKPSDDKSPEPSGDEGAEASETASDNRSGEEGAAIADEPAGETSETEPAETTETDDKPDTTEEPAEKDPAQAAYELSLERYERRMEGYAKELAEWEEKRQELVERGRQRSEVLNARFAEWYYVVSTRQFEDLQLKRRDFVAKKEPPAEEPKEDEKPGDETPGEETPGEGKPEEVKSGDEKSETGDAPAEDAPGSKETEATEKPAPGDE